MTEIPNNPDLSILATQAREQFENFLELREIGFVKDGDEYAIEQLLDDPTTWDEIDQESKAVILREMSSALGLDLLNLPPGKLITTYKEEGVRGAASEYGGEVRVYETNLSDVTVEITLYDSPEIGIRYNIVFGKEY